MEGEAAAAEDVCSLPFPFPFLLHQLLLLLLQSLPPSSSSQKNNFKRGLTCGDIQEKRRGEKKKKKLKTTRSNFGVNPKVERPMWGQPTFVEIIKPQALSFILGEFDIKL
ncbi:hypothetical protein AAC387_Pa10g0972 [Persea americana]|eukprot:TRINITY_DN772_c3_g1_i2.p1 TRINITY_DN772_c3_g1~~TRINITY_DN772_c3_g1_i2.p1  ORF type:complete len:110 (+),score=25.87 TRINITY_DN772_c3_g1_i2:85-414(+)